ncbi:helix-turn-helix domain-containing protein [Oscillospiraceae bacterium 42-9]
MEKISENFMPAVMKVEDLAKVLSIGLNSAYDLVRSGQVRSLKVGRIYRIPKSAVEEYLNSAG